MQSRTLRCTGARRSVRGTSAVLAVIALAVSLGASARAGEAFFDSDGVKIRYVEAGEGGGVPLVLVHGFAGNADLHWAVSGILASLAKTRRVIAIDCRGHGKSGKPHDVEAYGIELVEDVVRLLDHLGIERADVFGYSMGGLITLKLVTVHPDRVRRAVSGGYGWHRSDDVEGAKRFEKMAESLEKGEGFRVLFEALRPEGRPALPPEQLEAIDAMLTSINDVKALAAVVRSWKDLAIPEADLRANRVPTLCIIGSEDPLKDGVDRLEGVMANLGVEVIEGADHMTAGSHPDFLAKVREFLAAAAAPETGKPVPRGDR